MESSVEIFNNFAKSYNGIQKLHYLKNQNKFILYLFKAFCELQKLIEETSEIFQAESFSCGIYYKHILLNATKFRR